MPYDANGNYSLPAGYLAVTGETIEPSQHNPPLEDIAAALSSVLLRSGVASMSGNLNMNGYDITGAAAGAFTGNVGVSGTLSVTGAATLSSTLGVTGAATFTGNASVGGTFSVTGVSTFTGYADFQYTSSSGVRIDDSGGTPRAVLYPDTANDRIIVGNPNFDQISIHAGSDGRVNIFDGHLHLTGLSDQGTIVAPGVYGFWTTAAAANQHVDNTGRFYRSTSSGRYKVDRKAVTSALGIIAALKPTSFRSTHAGDHNRRLTGFIAEDVAAVLPEASADEGTNYDVRAIVAVLVAAVQELTARVEALENA